MKKYLEHEFPTEKSTNVEWDDFCLSHSFVNWTTMSNNIYRIVKWDGCITYETYSIWYDIYTSPLYKAMREE